MIPAEYEMRMVQARFREQYEQARLLRQAHESHPAVARPSVLELARSFLARLHLVRPVAGRSEATA